MIRYHCAVCAISTVSGEWLQDLCTLGYRGETIWVNAILYIVFERIAIYCHIAIFDWILVKGQSIWEYGFLRIYTLYELYK